MLPLRFNPGLRRRRRGMMEELHGLSGWEAEERGERTPGRRRHRCRSGDEALEVVVEEKQIGIVVEQTRVTKK
ncbi:hypothetical protein AKJ16_DCAP04120 [Drosera capensis]